MIIELCFLFFMVVYWLSEGCTEGYTWAKKARRTKNALIFGSVNKKGKPSGQGILDYHAWRLGENIGMVGSIFSAFLFTSFWSLLLQCVNVRSSWVANYYFFNTYESIPTRKRYN